MTFDPGYGETLASDEELQALTAGLRGALRACLTTPIKITI